MPRGGFETGRVFSHHWGRTITESETTLFSTLTLHFNPHYYNAAYAKAHGYRVTPVLGTGSMAPYIPAAPTGADPHATVMAYVVIDPAASFENITAGALCIYRTEWSPRYSVLHQAAQRDGLGWIMSGLHNPRSESAWRITPQNFDGIVRATFVWTP